MPAGFARPSTICSGGPDARQVNGTAGESVSCRPVTQPTDAKTVIHPAPDAARAPPAPSAWRPLRHRTFAVLWGATLLSNIGTWMHDMGAGWLMTSLDPSPVMVALVQAATTLPVFLFSLPAGALADIVDRRRMLLAVQAAMLVLAATLGLIVLGGAVTPALLLAFTFALGTCTAATSPAWNAIVPRLVPHEDFPSAVALNAVSINISRTIGPAIGGALITAFGLAWPFLVNAVSFCAVLAALAWWRTAPRTPTEQPRERLTGALGAGLMHAYASAPLKATLARALAFFIFASAYWALLPLIAQQRLAGDAQLFGTLVACIGAGAVLGAQFLPRLRQRFGPHRVVVAATLATTMVMATLALARQPAIAAGACVLAGASWIAALSTVNVSTQLVLPDWVRARGLALYNTLFYGALAFGSVCWGYVAERLGIPASLLMAATGALAAMALTWRFELRG